MARSANSFKRGAPKFKPQPTVLVLCEDKKSNKCYLEEAARHFRVHLEFDIVHCGKTDPKSIVEEAAFRKRKYDKLFCVIDRDQHENFDEAMGIASGIEGLTVIPSYPCFEFWYLLHFGYRRAPYVSAGNKSSAEALISDLRKCANMGDYAKGLQGGLFARLFEQFEPARNFAARVLADAQRDGQPNPSTHVHLLMTFMEQFAKPAPV